MAAATKLTLRKSGLLPIHVQRMTVLSTGLFSVADVFQILRLPPTDRKYLCITPKMDCVYDEHHREIFLRILSIAGNDLYLNIRRALPKQVLDPSH